MTQSGDITTKPTDAGVCEGRCKKLEEELAVLVNALNLHIPCYKFIWSIVKAFQCKAVATFNSGGFPCTHLPLARMLEHQDVILSPSSWASLFQDFHTSGFYVQNHDMLAFGTPENPILDILLN